MSKNLLNKLDSLLNSGELLSIVDRVFSASQVLTELGFSQKGQYISIVRKYLIDNDVDISHFTTTGKPKVLPVIKTCLCCGKEFSTIYRGVKEQTTCSRACSNTYYRSGENNGNWLGGHSSYRSKALAHYTNKCVDCGTEDIRVLQVHHIDSNRYNSKLDNLVILCANCHLIRHS